MQCPYCNSAIQPDWRYCPYCTMALCRAEGESITVNNATTPSYTKLAKYKATSTGLDWYIWSTCRDNKVRASHLFMENVIINWNDPPSPELLNNKEFVGYYHAGEINGCRCIALPLIQLSDVRWPHNVYRSGRIIRMQKEEFRRIFNGIFD